MSNPFKRRRSPIDEAKARFDEARSAVADVAGSIGDAAGSVRDSATTIADYVEQDDGRRLGAAGALVGLAGAAGYVVYRRLRSARGSGPSAGAPTVSGPSEDRLNDPALKSKVESELFRSPDAPKGKVIVGVANGVVTLRGELDSEQQIEGLARKAGEIDGVVAVENLIEPSGAGNGRKAAAKS